MSPQLRVSLEEVGGDPAMDTAVARALLERVDAGELPATLRLSRPPAVVAFSARDTRDQGFASAVEAAGQHGFGAVVRLAGGRPAVFTPRTIALSLAEPDPDPPAGITRRFRAVAELLHASLTGLGLDARIGPVPGEYCPGDWSVNLGGRTKVAGLGQRLLRSAAHTGGVVVVGDAARIRGVLSDVHAAMGITWDPTTTGQLATGDGGPSWETVRDTILEVAAGHADLVPWRIDATTLDLARRLVPQHRTGHRSRAVQRAPST